MAATRTDAPGAPAVPAAGAFAHTPELTGLRGFAAGWVLAFHLWQFAGRPAWWLAGIDFSPLVAGGHYGVDLFFVLSGFLLARPFLRARLAGAPDPSLPGFFLRRALRVLPAYWLQLALLVLAGGAAAHGAAELAMHATLSFNLVDNGSTINPVYWSLPVEWDFYLVLPLLALALPRSPRLPWLVPAAVVFALLFRVFCWQALFWDTPRVDVFRWVLQLPARIDQFVIGLAAAWWLAARPPPTPAARRALAWGGLLLLLAVAWITVLHGDGLTRERLPWAWVQAPLAALGGAGLILAAAGGGGDGPSRLWASRPLLFLGTISYSLYLWHYPVLVWLQSRALSPAALVPAAIGLSLAVATLSWWAVERPFQRINRRGG